MEGITSPDTRAALLQNEATQEKKFLFWNVRRGTWITLLTSSIALILLTVGLFFVFVIMRALVQNAMDKMEIDVVFVDVITPSKEDLDMNCKVRVKYDTFVNADVETAIAETYFNGERTGAFKLQAREWEKGAQTVEYVILTRLLVYNIRNFGDFSDEIFRQETVQLALSTKLKVSVWGIPYRGIDLQRTLSVKAMNAIHDPMPHVDGIRLSTCTSEIITLQVNTTMDNPSQLGFRQLPNLNMSVYYENEYVGYAMSQAPHMAFVRGTNHHSYLVTMNNSQSTKKTILRMIRGILKHNAQFYITGDNVHLVSNALLKEAFKSFNISVLYSEGMSQLQYSRDCGVMFFMKNVLVGNVLNRLDFLH